MSSFCCLGGKDISICNKMAQLTTYLLTLLSAHCLTILMHCGWRSRQRLYATTGDSRVLPAVHCLSQSTDFLFRFFNGQFSRLPEKEKKRKCGGCLFRPKNKTPKNKKMRFLAPKIKRKQNSVGIY